MKIKMLVGLVAVATLTACGGSLTQAPVSAPAKAITSGPRLAITRADAQKLADAFLPKLNGIYQAADLTQLPTILMPPALDGARGDITGHKIRGEAFDASKLAPAPATVFMTGQTDLPAMFVAAIPERVGGDTDIVATVLFRKASSDTPWLAALYVTSDGTEIPFKPALDKNGYLQITQPVTDGTAAMSTLTKYLQDVVKSGKTELTAQVADGPMPTIYGKNVRGSVVNMYNSGYQMVVDYQNGSLLAEFKGQDGGEITMSTFKETQRFTHKALCLKQDKGGQYFNDHLAAGNYRNVDVANQGMTLQSLPAAAGGKITVLGYDLSTTEVTSNDC